MTLFFDHSIHTGHYRIARQPRMYRGKRAAAWAKVEAAFSAPVDSLSFWVLAEALEEGGAGQEAMHPHAFLGYCIRQGWLKRM